MNELAQSVTAKAQASLGAAGFFFEQLDVSPKKFKVNMITESSFSQLVTIATEFPVIYVDGGNNTLIDSPNMHVSALKVAVVTQTNELRKPPRFSVETVDASVIITLEKIDGKKRYVIDLKSTATNNAISDNATADYSLPTFSPIELDDPILANTDENRVMVSLCGHVRQMLEWHFAKQHVQSVAGPTLLVLDGSFSPKNSTQTDTLTDLLDSAAKKEVLAVAVSKSTSLTTTGGYAIGPFLMSHAPFTSMWSTSPLAESLTLPVTMHFAKLASRAEHVVRIDISKHNGGIDVNRAIGVLAWLSQDASFPGYPYGLIKADDLARVSQEERDYQATRLMMSLDPLTQKQIRMLSASSNAHSVLDSLKF